MIMMNLLLITRRYQKYAWKGAGAMLTFVGIYLTWTFAVLI